MPVSDYFARSYDEARDKFLASARSAGARISSYPHPDRRGPAEEELAIDVAILGPVEAEIALLMISGTHGVEGFCGSGCQVGYLTDRLYEALSAGVMSILVHAVNPHGFAWLRRVNEDNVDLNRNFQDFSKPLPDSSAYEELHDILVPEEWEGPIREKSDTALMHYIQSRGQAVLCLPPRDSTPVKGIDSISPQTKSSTRPVVRTYSHGIDIRRMLQASTWLRTGTARARPQSPHSTSRRRPRHGACADCHARGRRDHCGNLRVGLERSD